MERFPKKAIVICVAIFTFFLIFHFPYQNLRGLVFKKVHQASRITLNAENMRPTLIGWPGIYFKNIVAAIPVGRGEINLASKSLTARIGLGGLLPPGPLLSLSVDGLQGGGDLYMKVKKSGEEVSIVFESDNLSIAQLKPSHLPDMVSGKLEADADFDLNISDLSKTNGEATVEMSEFVIAAQNLQGFIIPSLNMGKVDAEIEIENGVVQISRFRFGGEKADIEGTLEGQIKLAKDMKNTRIQLTIRCDLTEQYRKKPQSETLISFFESFRTPKGGYALGWDATIREMKTNFLKLIPQRRDS